MTQQRPFVIVGAGLAGARAAQTLREEGFDGRIVLFGEETERPYERPALSKGLLLRTSERDSVYVHDAGWYVDHDVDLRTGTRVTALDRRSRQVTVADGQRFHYDRLLLATGSRARTLPVPGAHLDGVLRLRTLADSDRISEALVDGANVVIVGAGWIGLEVAAAARTRGATVTVVETADLPLQNVLGDQLATVFADLHRAHGVTFHFGTQVHEFQGSNRVSAVLLADGTVLPADLVVVGVGVQPNTELAEQAGLAVDNGVLVDDTLRTSDPDIWAAGDLANAQHPMLGTRVRVEHWANALHSGPAAARGMLGQAVSYDRLPYFYTDQYELGMEYTGHAPPGSYDRIVVRGELTSGEFIAFWTAQGRVLAGMNVNVWEVTGPIGELIRSRQPVDLDRLADPTVALDSLIRRG
ncbi:3-phenylpropionate/trans-cinnamate dioxygenase ferredoxin reductase subunit [Micromonospora purpureochromogenes]|uniref:3-phenylpropionate/trans-cinnamate dioxygenase ferredoxin reductase subunit n=1 Tax=Micromonospora purpureochromogenes TaxID=47872 RepID=A0A1C5A8S6_9ACTN|nr:FAD-dependent oxidoreductase [Micromonospora purpureochromogenes]SCF41642.1 3-phenylpropionate/trans-cinnamate dioxygenase ferredoxin reductase subunit [Micromonospora purpureochromogenes]